MGWQGPTLPHPCGCSTLGAGRLNHRVRDGTGCTLAARLTNTLLLVPLFSSTRLHAHSFHARAPNSPEHKPKPSTFSTGQLQMLPPFHLRPIQLVVYQRSSSFSGWGVSSSGAFPT